jgi:hypothetical protein
MKITTIITVLSAVLFVSCQKEKIDNDSMFKILTTAIDASLRLDPALNQGDTLYIELSKGLMINDNVTKCLIHYLSKKNEFQIVLSDIESVMKKDPVSPDHPNLRNFCITVLEIKYKTRSTIAVSTEKYKGMLGADIIETIFKFEKGNWINSGSRIISAS